MKYYMIEPEVAGEIGENTIYDNYDEIINQKKKPIISHLHYIFDGWLGDELLEVTPCFPQLDGTGVDLNLLLAKSDV